MRLLQELAHRAGSVDNLRKIVEEHETSATKAVRKRKEEICNKLPDDVAAISPTPAAAAPADGAPPGVQPADDDATKTPGENSSSGDSAADAAPPAPDAGPDEPLT